MELLRELTATKKEDTVDALPITEALEEAVKSLNLRSGGGKVASKVAGAAALFKANPALVAGATGLAIGAYLQYQKNKKNTIKLHAKDSYEKEMMTSIVDVLTKGGKFKVQRIKFEGGGKTWVLRRQS